MLDRLKLTVKNDNMLSKPYLFPSTPLINSIIHEQSYKVFNLSLSKLRI